MKFTVLNWNIGGAKFLEEKTREERERTRAKFNEALLTIITDRDVGPQPDVITLQEIVRYREPDDLEVKDLFSEIPGYSYFPFPLIDTKIISSKAKWNKILKNSDWHPRTYFAQGNAFLIKNTAPHFPVWDLSDLEQTRPGECGDHFIELVHLDSGLYFGDRNTEPRAALVAHFICDPVDLSSEVSRGDGRKPLDIFVVNLHLTTLMLEREGVPEIDAQAAKIRQSQLDVVFNGIVSRYNSWKRSGYRERGDPRKPEAYETFDRHSPVWVIAGDFNFTEESAEYAYIKRVNFIDTVPEDGKKSRWGHGTKASGVGNDPTLTLDYIFAGPKFVSLDPAIVAEMHRNRVIHDHKLRASDHYPVLSSMTLIPS
jgi:endonuclease/exonuclease/phosphatase family metal-dependent hydrolase